MFATLFRVARVAGQRLGRAPVAVTATTTLLGLSVGGLVGLGSGAAGVPAVVPLPPSPPSAAAPVSDESDSEEMPQGDNLLGDPLPVVQAPLTQAPNVPLPLNRNYPVKLVVNLTTAALVAPISPTEKYPVWTFGPGVPGPFIRARVGDVMEVRYTNNDTNGIGHNIDFHAVTGPGGGAPALYAEPGETKVGTFKLLHPGLFVYHCAAAPVPMHIANGMYGLLLVEPEQGLPRVDREYYVMQSEFYTERAPGTDVLDPSYANGLAEHPSHVVFNGRVGALTEAPLRATQGDRVRIYFGNAGPNLVSSFHVIGTIFDKVYREGDLISPPARSVQSTLVPAGGSTVVEIDLPVPGSYTLVDHSIFRLDKGCVGFLKVQTLGHARRDIYASGEPPVQCAGCKLHN